MKRQAEYTVVTGQGYGTFIRNVNDRIKKGWEAIGGVDYCNTRDRPNTISKLWSCTKT